MGWLIVIGLAAIVFAALVWLGKLPRGAREMTGAALLLGLAGYAWQNHASQAGAPKAPIEESGTAQDQEIVAQRQAMGERFGDAQSLLILSDSFSSRGKYGTAAVILRQAVKDHPDEADLWVALGNALIGHSDGQISPAAVFALQRAADIAPDHPGPPFFLGLSLAQSGRLEEARALWSELLARSPEDAPWRPDLEQRIGMVDSMLGRATPPAGGAGAPGAPGAAATPPATPPPAAQPPAPAPDPAPGG